MLKRVKQSVGTLSMAAGWVDELKMCRAVIHKRNGDTMCNSRFDLRPAVLCMLRRCRMKVAYLRNSDKHIDPIIFIIKKWETVNVCAM